MHSLEIVLESQRKPGEIVIVIDVAEKGFRYYASRLGLREGQDYVAVRSMDAFDEVVHAHGAKSVLLVTTFRRAFRLRFPEWAARFQNEWKVVQTFPATVGDGAIAVWASPER